MDPSGFLIPLDQNIVLCFEKDNSVIYPALPHPFQNISQLRKGFGGPYIDSDCRLFDFSRGGVDQLGKGRNQRNRKIIDAVIPEILEHF